MDRRQFTSVFLSSIPLLVAGRAFPRSENTPTRSLPRYRLGQVLGPDDGLSIRFHDSDGNAVDPSTLLYAVDPKDRPRTGLFGYKESRGRILHPRVAAIMAEEKNLRPVLKKADVGHYFLSHIPESGRVFMGCEYPSMDPFYMNGLKPGVYTMKWTWSTADGCQALQDFEVIE